MQLAKSTWSHELAASSLVALKLSNIKVGRQARGMCNYNLDMLLCSSTKIKRPCSLHKYVQSAIVVTVTANLAKAN